MSRQGNNPKGFDTSLIDHPTENPNVGVFTLKTANQTVEDASKRPMPNKLFGQLWWEQQLTILFGDNGCGKSILAVQIADAVSRGANDVMGLEMTAEPQPVLYCDFELSDKQFEMRYMSEDGKTHHRFSDNLLRVEINPDADWQDGGDFEDAVKSSLEQVVTERGVKVVIVDNITWVHRETEKAKDAIPLMKWLKAFGRKYGLSLLVLAHTPKRNDSNPITKNDLSGSKNLSNFCDVLFAIGTSSQGEAVRFIKELKQRNTSNKYGAENVMVCELVKDDNFSQFRFVGFGCESEHLRQIDDATREDLTTRAKALAAKGKSQREIASELGCSLGAVNKYLKS